MRGRFQHNGRARATRPLAAWRPFWKLSVPEIFPLVSADPATWPSAPRPGWQPLLDQALVEAFSLMGQAQAEREALGRRWARPLALSLRLKEKFGFLNCAPGWVALEESFHASSDPWFDSKFKAANERELTDMLGERDVWRQFCPPFWKADFLSSAVCADCAAPGRPRNIGFFMITACEPCARRLAALPSEDRVAEPKTPAAIAFSPFLHALLNLDYVANKRLAERRDDFLDWSLPAQTAGSAAGSASISALASVFLTLSLGRNALSSERPLWPGPELLAEDPEVREAERAALAAAAQEGGPNADLGLGARAAAYCSTRYSVAACAKAGVDWSLRDAEGRAALEVLSLRAGNGELASIAEASALSLAAGQSRPDSAIGSHLSPDEASRRAPPRL